MSSGSYAHLPLILDILRDTDAPPEIPNHGTILVFLDENDAQVTIRLSDKALRNLKRTLDERATKEPE